MRTAIVAHFTTDAFINNLDKQIYNICYKSKKFNYVYLYFNMDNKENVIKELNNIEEITNIEDSLLDVEKI